MTDGYSRPGSTLAERQGAARVLVALAEKHQQPVPEWVNELLALRPGSVPNGLGDRYSRPGSTLADRQGAARVLQALAEKRHEPIPEWVTELLAQSDQSDPHRRPNTPYESDYQ